MPHPVDVRIEPVLHDRDRISCAFRPILAIPHLLLVGGPAALAISIVWSEDRPRIEWGAATGALGAVAAVCALIAWFAIVFGGRYPEGLRSLAIFYLRWRVRAGAYLLMLRDEYPPFGEGAYPAALTLDAINEENRDRLSVAFRAFLIVPHAIAVWVLGICGIFTTIAAWVAVIVTGQFPEPLYRFAAGMLRWGTRVEAYLLLLHDDYPPFSLR